MNFIYDLHRTMLSRNLMLVFQGDFTQETTKSILAMAERNLDASGEDTNIKRKVFNVMVELLQNIVKHGLPESANVPRNAIFLIGREPDCYFIVSGNPVPAAQVGVLRTKLEKLNALDKDGLKNLYKDIIKNATLSDKGGAGLGFVDIARKSGEKLEFDFPEMSKDYSFFSLKVIVQRGTAD